MTASAPFRRADELRREFDDAFAAAAVMRDVQPDDLLAIRLRGDPHAIRLADVSRLQRAGALVRYPSTAAAWLGLAGVAGGVVPVYDLGVLAGYPPGGPPDWIAVCAAAPVALAFDSFDGQVRHMVERTPHGAPASGVVRVDDTSYPLIDIGGLIERLRSSVGEPARTASPTPTLPPSVGG